MTYTLRNSYTVTTHRTDTGTEFVTRNPAGEVTSTARLSGLQARVMLAAIERSASN